MTVKANPIFRYLAPFFTFMIFTELQRWGSATSVFWIYGLKTLTTALVFCICFKSFQHEIIGYFDLKAVGLGLLVLVIWVVPYAFIDVPKEVTFNPEAFDSVLTRFIAILFRMLGASLIVPLIEELVWRSFLMRYLIKKDFLGVSIGTYAHLAFWGTVIAFTLVHRMWEWPVAFITGILYGLYLVKTKNLIGCIIAHSVTNLGLAFYVLITKQWYFW